MVVTLPQQKAIIKYYLSVRLGKLDIVMKTPHRGVLASWKLQPIITQGVGSVKGTQVHISSIVTLN